MSSVEFESVLGSSATVADSVASTDSTEFTDCADAVSVLLGVEAALFPQPTARDSRSAAEVKQASVRFTFISQPPNMIRMSVF